MKALLVQRTGCTATVRLTPSWIARLFGARVVLCDLEANGRDGDGELRWRYAATGRLVRCTPHGSKILLAMERAAISDLPQAIAREA